MGSVNNWKSCLGFRKFDSKWKSNKISDKNEQQIKSLKTQVTKQKKTEAAFFSKLQEQKLFQIILKESKFQMNAQVGLNWKSTRRHFDLRVIDSLYNMGPQRRHLGLF